MPCDLPLLLDCMLVDDLDECEPPPEDEDDGLEALDFGDAGFGEEGLGADGFDADGLEGEGLGLDKLGFGAAGFGALGAGVAGFETLGAGVGAGFGAEGVGLLGERWSDVVTCPLGGSAAGLEGSECGLPADGPGCCAGRGVGLDCPAWLGLCPPEWPLEPWYPPCESWS
ncbi:MAG: hypothetical protein K6G91_08605 [Kiritimatiellae bacterium]|nr:hypothetical protein [Kiritimatiellia bacterium]